MIAISGYIRVPVEARTGLEPHLQSYVPACRAELSCLCFSLAYDVLEPELLRVFEIWKDDVGLRAHIESDHETEWREACKRLGAGVHALMRHDIVASASIG